MDSVVAALGSASTREVAIDGVTWRIRLLDPALAAQANALREAVATILAPQQLANERLDPKARAVYERLARQPRILEDSKAAEIEARILQSCVLAARSPRLDAPWESIHLVLHQQEERLDAGRVWVVALPPMTRMMLLAHILVHLKEAGEVLAPFCDGSADGVAAGRDGLEVRNDPR